MAKGSWSRTIRLLGNNRDIIKKLNQTNAKLKQNEEASQKTQKTASKSFKAIGVSVTAMVVTIGIAMARAIGDFVEFEQTIADLRATTGATTTELAEMEAQALKLGRTTMFTASQVATLQKEYSKLGFSVDEILAVTAATLNLAAASREDLATSAVIAGSTLRGFQMDASETGRVADTMSASFRNSALDMEKFTNSMKFVAPAANAVGLSVEQTTALLGTMADVNISGSMAGTGLRKILVEISNENSKFSKKVGGSIKSMDDFVEKMKILKKEGFGLGEATRLMGLRANTAFLALVENTPRIEELNKVLDESAGDAERMAEIQMDTLRGASLEAKSATEGLKIAFASLIQDGLLEATDTYTELINVMTDAIQIPVSEKLREERIEFKSLAGVLLDATISQETRNRVIKDLQDKYPGYLKNIDLETTNMEDLAIALDDVNKEMLRKIEITAKEEILAESRARWAKAQEIYYREQIKFQKIEEEGVSIVRQKGEVVMNTAIALENQSRVVENNRKNAEKAKTAYEGLAKALSSVGDEVDKTDPKSKIVSTDIGGGEDDPDGPLEDKELKRFLVKEAWEKRGLELENLMYEARLAAVDVYYARQEAALLDAGLTEVEIAQRIEDEKAEIKRQSNMIMWELTAQGLGGLTALAEAFGKRGSLTAKRLAQFETMVSAHASAQKAYESGVKSPIPAPGNLIFGRVLQGVAYAEGLARAKKIGAQKFAEGAIFKKPVFSPLLKGGAIAGEVDSEAVLPLGRSGGIFGLMVKELKNLRRDISKMEPQVNLNAEIDGIEFYEETVRPAERQVQGADW